MKLHRYMHAATVGVMLSLAAPLAHVCRAQAATGVVTRKVHRMSDQLTLIEAGDTLIVVRPADTVSSRNRPPSLKGRPPMVAVLLLDGDSTFILQHGARAPLNPTMAKSMRLLLHMAHQEEAGLTPKPQP